MRVRSIGVVAFILAVSFSVSAEKFSIVGLADPRSGHATFRNALEEVRDRAVLGDVAAAKCIVVCGDIDP
jgi:hypothetical protein